MNYYLVCNMEPDYYDYEDQHAIRDDEHEYYEEDEEYPEENDWSDSGDWEDGYGREDLGWDGGYED